MNLRRPVILFLALVGMWLCCMSISTECKAQEPQYLIKFATVAPEGSTWVRQMESLDKELRSKSQGQLGFRIYAGGIAGDELDTLKKIRIGQIHCAGFSGVGFGQILPMVRVLDLPFLFNNYGEVDLVHTKMHPFFADQFRKNGFELLAWSEVGNVYLFSKKPIRTLLDLSGLKVWVWAGDPIAKETFAAMGVNPIPLAITDVTTGINTGMIDTVYAPPLAALALQWHTSMNYMLQLPIVHSTGAVLISSKYFASLPQELSKLLSDETEKAMAGLTIELRKQSEEAVKIIRDSGVKITPEPTGADLTEFKSIHDRVATKLAGTVYPKDVLDTVYGLLKAQ